MPRDDEVKKEGAAQHQKRCPSCLSKRTTFVAKENHMGCDTCGHVWAGKDFGQDQEG